MDGRFENTATATKLNGWKCRLRKKGKRKNDESMCSAANGRKHAYSEKLSFKITVDQ